MPCPFLDGEDAVEVIGHYHESLERDGGEVVGNIEPATASNFTGWSQMDHVILNLAEGAQFSERTNGYKIKAALGVVEVREADGAASWEVASFG